MNRHTVRRKYIYRGELKAFMPNYRPNYRTNTNLGLLFCIIFTEKRTVRKYLE